jgi:nucleoside-diphosphate-sugar epimerase
MRIIVTGAAGFIGSHLCERLLQDDRNEVMPGDVQVGVTTFNLM